MNNTASNHYKIGFNPNCLMRNYSGGISFKPVDKCAADTLAHMSSIDFRYNLKLLLEFRKMSQAKLAEAIYMNDKTIQSYRRSQNPATPTLETCTKICVSLSLPPDLGRMFVASAGYNLQNSFNNPTYKYVIENLTMYSPQECDNALIYYHLPPLFNPSLQTAAKLAPDEKLATYILSH